MSQKSYKITIMLKRGILDNAGKATTKALNNLGFKTVEDVRIGKCVYLTTDKDIEPIAQALYNNVMEEYEVKCLDDAD